MLLVYLGNQAELLPFSRGIVGTPILLAVDSINIARKRKRSTQLVASLIVALSLFGVLGSGTIPPAHASAPSGAYFDHVVVIMMENEGIDNICGSHPPPCSGSNTPYMDSLANNFSLGVQYTSVIHPLSSDPNYVAVIGGSTFTCPSNCVNINAPTLIDRFQAAGLTWKGYMESMQQSSGCDTSSSQEPYNNIHNPFISFSEFVQNGVPNAANCNNILLANPSTCAAATDCALVNDLNSGPSSAPNFIWLTPNDCNNMHATSGCANGCTSGGSSTCIKEGDSYLKSLVPNILNSKTFTSSRSALFITYDEGQDYCPLNGSSSEDCIYALWAGPAAKNGFSTTSLFNHYSLTKTIETNWNLAALTSNDGNAQAMTGFFKAQAPDFTMTSSPSTVSFVAGSTGSFTVTVSGQNGFTGTVNLSPSTTSSTGLSITCNPSSISGGSGSSSCTLTSSTPGSYTVTITGTSGSLSHSTGATVMVTQPPKPDFAISANPSSLKIVQGSSGTSTISLTSLGGFSGTISLSGTVSPSGPIASLNPTSVTLASNGAGSSTLNVTSNSSAIGAYNVNVTGISGSISHSTIVAVSVIQQPPPPDFSISASPSSLTLGGSSSSRLSSVTVTTSGDRTWFESSYLADSFYAQGLYWLFYEDSSVSCESMAGCLLYTTSSTGSSWASPTNVNIHVTDSDFSVYTDGSRVYYARYDEAVFQSDCGKNVYFRTGNLSGTGNISWQSEQPALKAGSQFTYENEEVIVDSNGQAWIALLSNSRGSCGGNGTELPQIIHSSGTNYGSWSSPFTLSTAHSNNWHVALVSLGSGQIYASFWLAGADLHGRLFAGTSWGSDEQISATTTQNDVNAWLFNSGTSVYAIYFDNNPETFNFASRSSSGTWTTNVIGVGESRTGSKFSSSYYSFPDAASYDPTHNQFYLFWMNATLQRIDEWKGSGSKWTQTTKALAIAAAPYPDSITSFITSSPTNSFPTTGGVFYVTGTGPFTINFAALPLSGSSTGTFTVTITSLNGFTGTVNLATWISPSTGLTAACSPTSVSGGYGQSSCTVTGTTAGNYNVTATGTSGSLSHSASVSVVVQSSSTDFTISASPSSLTLNSGATGPSTITVAPQNGFSGTVNLAVLTNSTNLTCSLSSSSIVGGSGSSTLSCSGSPAGNYRATVTGTNGTGSRSATVTYKVQDFALGASPTSEYVGVGVTGNSTITVSSLNGFSGTTSLAVITNSTALVCSLSNPSVTGSGTSNLSCTGVLVGNYLANVTGTSGNLAHATNVVYHIITVPAKDFTITANPTNLVVDSGNLGNSTITVTPANGFSGTVILSVSTNSTSLTCTLSQATIDGGSGKSILSCQGSPFGNYLANVTGTSGSLSHSTTVTYQVADFAISTSPTDVTAQAYQPGQAQHPPPGNSTVTIAPQNGFARNLAMSFATNSTNISCTLSPTTINGGSGSSTLSCISNAAGNYLTKVTATDAALSHSTTVTYHVQDFTIAAAPSSISESVGIQGNSTVSVASLNGFAGTVTLSVATTSANLSCNLSSTSISGASGTSTLSCSASVQGKYNATVSGTSGNASHSVVVVYSLTAPDFTLSASPTSISVVQGSSGTSNVTLASVNGFSGSVSLTASISPTGLGDGFSPPSVPLISSGTGSSTLNITSPGASPGIYSVNVTATSGLLSHSILIRVSVTTIAKPSPYSLIVSYEGFVYKLFPNNTLVQIGQPVTTQLSVVAWRPDGSCAIIAGNAAVLIKYDGTTLTIVPTGIPTSINFLSAAWRPDGSYALVGGSGGVLLKYDCNTVTQVSNSFAVSFRALSWKPDDSQALLVSYFGKIYLYSSSSGSIIQLTSPTGQSLDAVAWNPNGSYALLAGSGGAVLRYNGTAFQVLNTAGTYSSTLTVRYISFNPTSSLALLVGDSGLAVTYDGTTLAALPSATTSTLYSVSWSNGTAYIAGGSGALVTYSQGVETKVSIGSFSGFRSIAWKP